MCQNEGMSGEKYRSANWKESRRLLAQELKKAGWKQEDIPMASNVSAAAVSQRMRGAEACEPGPKATDSGSLVARSAGVRIARRGETLAG